MSELIRQALIDGEAAGARYALTPPRAAVHGLLGAQLANRPGSSIEFMDYREYQLGDDLRRVDWSAYARTDRLIVKLYREEVSPHLDLVIDGSRSMALPGSRKAQGAAALAAVLATAAATSGFTHATYLAAAHCTPLPNGHDRPSAWQGLSFDYAGDPEQALHRSPPAWRRRGVRVLISDLLWLGEPLPVVSRLAQGAAAVVVIQVLAQADAEPPQRGNLRLEDAETGQVRELFVDAAAQQRYRDALARHQDHWSRACRQVGAMMTTLIAERLLEDWSLSDLVAAEFLRVV